MKRAFVVEIGGGPDFSRVEAEVVPLRIDPEDGMFWFEFPEGESQYCGCIRSEVVRGIHKIVEDYHTEGTWAPYIAVEELVNTYKKGNDPGHVPAHVGFNRLFRFEMSKIELRLPHLGNDHTDGGMLYMINGAMDKPESDFFWHKTVNKSYRPFGDDDGYLYLGDGGHTSFSVYGCKVFPYSDDLWGRLLAIHQACIDMHLKLSALLDGTPDEIQTRILEAMHPGLPMLGGGA